MSWDWHGEEAKSALLAANRRAVQKTCFVVLAASKLEVPLDEGTLMASGRVFMAPEPNAFGIVSYGGGTGTGFPKVPYALRWHQNEANFQHGRKSGYLVDPFNRLAQPVLRDAIRQEAKKDFG